MSAAGWSQEMIPLTSHVLWHCPLNYNLLLTAKFSNEFLWHTGDSAEYKHTSGDILYPTAKTLQF